MVTSFQTRGLNRDEFTRLIESLLRDWQASKVASDDVVLTKLKTRLTTTLASYQESLAQVTDQGATESLLAADQARDKDLRWLYEMVKLAQWQKGKEEQAAYKTLWPLFTDAIKAQKANYEEESAYISRLLGQLGTAPYQAAATLLGLTKGIQELTKSQAAMEALLLKKHTAKASQKVYDKKALRKTLQDTYQRLGHYLLIMSEEVGTVAYTKLFKVYQTNHELFKPLATRYPLKSKERPASAPQAEPAPQEESH